jgi:uncharacterized integral membrane protein (TIGR00698 family)
VLLTRTAAAAALLAGAVWSLTPWATPALALGAGVVCALALGNPWTARTGVASSLLLQLAVVGLGFGIPLASLLTGGLLGVAYSIVLIAGVFALGLWLGSRLAVERRLTILITGGTSICGGSAVAALGPAIGASREAMSVSLATVFVLNALALYTFPPIGHWVGLSEHQFGVWAALAIHDTSSVVGASSSYGAIALREATVLKLARALWIVPMVLVVSLAMHRSPGRPVKSWLPVPWFIALFVIAAFARSLAPVNALPWFDGVVGVARAVLVLVLFLIGASLTREQLRNVGTRPLLHGLILWLCVALTTLGAVVAGVPR